jgi:hypothetical protein
MRLFVRGPILQRAYIRAFLKAHIRVSRRNHIRVLMSKSLTSYKDPHGRVLISSAIIAFSLRQLLKFNECRIPHTV